MSSTPPSRDNGYTIPVDARADRELFQGVFSDIHDRLNPVEAKQADFDEAINLIVTQALAIVSANVGQEIEDQRAILSAIQAQAEEILDEYQSRNIPAARVLLDAIPGLAATTAQAAIAELLSKKADLAGATYTGLVSFFEGTVARAGLNLQQRGTAPSNPANGDIWPLATGLSGTFGGVTRQFYDTATLPPPSNAEIDAGVNQLRKAWTVVDVWRAARAALAASLALKFDKTGGAVTGPVRSLSGPGSGSICLQPGESRHTGFLDFLHPNGARAASIGYVDGGGNKAIHIAAENGNWFAFSGVRPRYGSELMTITSDLVFSNIGGAVQPTQQVLRPDELGGIGSSINAIAMDAPSTIYGIGAGPASGANLGDPANPGARPVGGLWRCAGFVTTDGNNRRIHKWMRYA